MKTSEQIDLLAAASGKAQATMRPALKDSINPAYKSKYADLASVWEACRGPLTENGITVWQDVTAVEGGMAVTTRLVHSSGQWVEFGPLPVPLSKHDAHGVGSAIQYGRRYGFAAAVGAVADLDDDGNAAVAKTNGKDAGRITEKQAADLSALIDEVGADRAKFLKYVKADKVSDILAASYAECVRQLEAKRVTQ